jgi:hypothetical protein
LSRASAEYLLYLSQMNYLTTGAPDVAAMRRSAAKEHLAAFFDAIEEQLAKVSYHPWNPK